MLGDGVGYVPDSIPPGAEVVVLAQNPGADEEAGRKVVGYDGKKAIYEACEPQPLVGKTGWDVRTRFAPLLGCEEVLIGYANVLKCRLQTPERTNDLPKGATLSQAIQHCTQAHLRIPQGVKLVIAMGAVAWEWTQQAKLPITDWRGFQGPRSL